MDKEFIREELRNNISDFFTGQGLELVDLIYRYEGKNLFLRILCDRPEGGITMDECARINEELGRLLDEKNIIGSPYILEVSSPGVDRPLRTKGDFLRCLNRRALFFLREPLNGKLEWQGIISKVTDEAVEVEIDGNIIVIALVNISKAKQIV